MTSDPAVKKHLLLLRHAKAMPGGAGLPDRDRPLAERGHRDAGLMGEAIAKDHAPEVVVCSPATRTRQTMDEVIARLRDGPEVVLAETLYGGDEKIYLETIMGHAGTARRLLLVGHNPMIHLLAIALAKAPSAKLRGKFPTAALAIIGFEVDEWSKIGPGKGELELFLRPKDLGAGDADD